MQFFNVFRIKDMWFLVLDVKDGYFSSFLEARSETFQVNRLSFSASPRMTCRRNSFPLLLLSLFIAEN